jgi:CDP-diacylglycerol--serine O-phosphatidyltransferase
MKQIDNSARKTRRLVPKPACLARFEKQLAERVPFHPNVISAFKLLVIAPALLLSLEQTGAWGGAWLISLLFLAFGALDYLDGVVARERGLATRFGRIFDRVTDYPLIIGLSYFCVDVLPLSLVALKVAVDLLLLVLYSLGRGSTENRLRTATSYTALFGLLALSQGWAPALVTPSVLVFLLIANIAFSATVALYNLDVLQKRFIADLLSLGNLCCGVLAMVAASRGRFEVSLLLLILGAGFDGVDGAAARRWGSTRWGVYSDDVADAVNFAIAPGVLVYFALGGAQGVVVGSFYALFTLSRLVFFTLNKADADPNYFSGVPSTVGGLITTSAVILFEGQPSLIGLMVGIACAQMVSFSTYYRHIGRVLAQHRRLLLSSPLGLIPLGLGAVFFGVRGAVAVVFVFSVAYGMLPMARSFARAGRAYRKTRVLNRHRQPAVALGTRA